MYSVTTRLEENSRMLRKPGTDGKTMILWQPQVKKTFFYSNQLRGTVSAISSNPPCKDGNARFTTILLKVLSDQV